MLISLARHVKTAFLSDFHSIQRMASAKAISGRKSKQHEGFDEDYEDDDEKFPSEMTNGSADEAKQTDAPPSPPGVGFISFGATASGASCCDACMQFCLALDYLLLHAYGIDIHTGVKLLDLLSCFIT